METDWLVGWLFWVKRPFETVFLSISGRLLKGGRKRRERIDESKNVQTTPTRTYCKRSRPCPTEIRILGRPGTECLPSKTQYDEKCDVATFHSNSVVTLYFIKSVCIM